jgi:hypothetical protein
MPSLAAAPSPLLASLALSVGVVVLFVANLFIALGEPAGTPGNLRLLQFLAPADLAVAGLMIVAVALVSMVTTAAVAPASPTVPIAGGAPPELAPTTVGTTAAMVAAVVGAGALIRAITVLTISHQHGAIKVGNMFDALAAVLVAAVAVLWVVRRR